MDCPLAPRYRSNRTWATTSTPSLRRVRVSVAALGGRPSLVGLVLAGVPWGAGFRR